MATKQTFGVPTIRVPATVKDQQTRLSLLDMARQTEFWLRQVMKRVDEQHGNRGTPTFTAPIDMQGNKVMKVGTPTADTDAQQFGLCLHTGDDGNYDAQGRFITNLRQASTDNQGVNLRQLKQEIAALRQLITGTTEGSPFTLSSFTATGTGFAADPSATAKYVFIGTRIVVLFLPQLTGTSDAATFTITGMPSSIQPTETSLHPVGIVDNSVAAFGLLRLNSGSTTIDVFPDAALSGWTAANTKTLRATTVAYILTA